MTEPGATALSRRVAGRAAAPVRQLHLGLGNFFRAHQAWYSEHSPDAESWGIAAFTGRSAALAEQLSRQDGLYTLAARAGDGDRIEVVSAVSAAHSGLEHDRLLAYFSSPQLAIVTLTVTEAGYRRGADGHLSFDDDQVAIDLQTLQSGSGGAVLSAPAKLVAGLGARYRSGGGDLAIVSCDNLPENGDVTRRVVTDLCARLDPALLDWIHAHVSFVSTVVDRITPATTDADLASAYRHTGYLDEAPVVTEPYSEWVLAGQFPAGRPAWDVAGATIVDDVRPYENRKLWLLNGAHSLLAYAGPLRGHETVDSAVRDEQCLAWVQQWWDEAAAQLELPEAEVRDYRDSLVDRFSNVGIQHRLAQIAADGSQKLPIRVVPVVRAARARGGSTVGGARILAAWICHLRGSGAPVRDPSAESLVQLAAGTPADAVRRVLQSLDPVLGDDTGLGEQVLELLSELDAAAR